MIILIALVIGLPVAFVLRGLIGANWSEITDTTTLATEDVIYVPRFEVFLVNGTLPIALLAASPHQGETLVYCKAGQNFLSLQHGEQFDRLGRYITGPALHGMDRAEVRVRDGFIELNMARVTIGPPTTPRVVPEVTPCTADSVVFGSAGFVEPAPPAV